MNVPLVDLRWQHAQVKDAVEPVLEELMANGSFILGATVASFEDEFAKFSGIEHCVGVASGTDALELAIRALDLEPGSEIIVPTNSFIASAAAVVRAGHRPLLVDVDKETLLLDFACVQEAITPITRAVMPVHLFGRLVDMPRLASLVEGRGLRIIEDAAQAQGAIGDGFGLGTHSDVVATSFYPGKNLGAYGDGGAVLTNDAAISHEVRLLRDHGSLVKYQHEIIGTNSRLDSLQAAVLSIKLTYLDDWNELRRDAARTYQAMLGDVEKVQVPTAPNDMSNVWHLYVIEVPERDRVLQALQSNGVGAGIHYPCPIHRQGAMLSVVAEPLRLPVAESAAERILSLPIFPGITMNQQEFVVSTLVSALK